jgi:hypothetical protein
MVPKIYSCAFNFHLSNHLLVIYDRVRQSLQKSEQKFCLGYLVCQHLTNLNIYTSRTYKRIGASEDI